MASSIIMESDSSTGYEAVMGSTGYETVMGNYASNVTRDIPEGDGLSEYEAMARNNASNVTLNIPEGVVTEVEHFTICSNEFRMMRWILRCLSLWHPQSACCLESIIYPVFINVWLLYMLSEEIFFLYTIRHHWQNIQGEILYTIYALGVYLSHSLGVFYFRSRDLEENMINIKLEPAHARQFRRRLKLLTRWSVLAFLLLIVIRFFIFFYTDLWSQCNSLLTFIHGFANHFVCFLSHFPTNIYAVGISLSFMWIICLLQQTARIRLEQLEKRYYLWTNTSEDAIYDYITNYSRKIRKSCNALSKWFIAHNLMLVIAIPFLIFDILQGQENNWKTTLLFDFYLMYAFVIWVSPLFFAEKLQIHDDNFISSINNLCTGVIMEMEATENAAQNLRQNAPDRTFTFQSRSEVNKLLTYLKTRKSGFIVGHYSFQLKLSMFSLVLGLIAFASRLVDV